MTNFGDRTTGAFSWLPNQKIGPKSPKIGCKELPGHWARVFPRIRLARARALCFFEPRCVEPGGGWRERTRSSSDDDRVRAAHCARREAHGRKGVRVLGRDDDDDDDVDRDDDGEREAASRAPREPRALPCRDGTGGDRG